MSTSPSTFKFCKNCGTAVELRLPDDGDSRVRAVCPSCKTVHYENPLNVVGTLPIWGDKVLLCKRNIEPRLGKWTLPAGFLEMGETLQEGASRETVEEAGAEFELENLFSIMSVARVGQIHIFYKARLISDKFNPGYETMEAKLFEEAEIPWEEIAFKTVKETLKNYFEDRKLGFFKIHQLVIH
jgi:ADP-ribose pyrophosphatase YjhB (NUDIX family)